MIEAYIYGLVVGSTLCSFCAVPLVYFSSRAYMGDHRAVLYLFLTRTAMVIVAVPLILLGAVITLLASIAMIAVGTRAFMDSLEKRQFACRPHTAALGGLICVSEGFPAVLAATSFIAAMGNALLFSLGTITPLLFFMRFRRRLGQRWQLVFSGLLITFAFYLFYRSLLLLVIM